MRRDLALIGALLSMGGAVVMFAAFLPALYPVWIARGTNAIPLIGQHRGTWQLANWLFAIGAALTLAGLGALTGLLNRQPTTSTMPSAALAVMAVASTLWLANLAFRLSVTVGITDTATGGGAVPTWYEPVNAWTGAMWSAAALTGALAMIDYGLAASAGHVLPGWTGWLAVGFGVLIIGLFATVRDVPPFLLYVAPMVFGITALIRAASTTTP